MPLLAKGGFPGKVEPTAYMPGRPLSSLVQAHFKARILSRIRTTSLPSCNKLNLPDQRAFSIVLPQPSFGTMPITSEFELKKLMEMNKILETRFNKGLYIFLPFHFSNGFYSWKEH